MVIRDETKNHFDSSHYSFITLCFYSMNNTELNITQLLHDPTFKEIQSIGLIDEIALRNLIIRNEYTKLKETKTQLGAIFELSEKYTLSFDSIHHILYRKQFRKTFPLSLSN
jgi:hypothetical protein